MFLPDRIDTLFKHWPVANWVIMAFAIVMFFVSHTMSDDTLEALVLGGTWPVGLVTHLFLHGGIVHLAGNLLSARWPARQSA